MTTNEISGNVSNKSFYDSAFAVRTGIEQLNLETQWTDHIQRLIDYGNKHYLRNFYLKIEMEDTETSGGH